MCVRLTRDVRAVRFTWREAHCSRVVMQASSFLPASWTINANYRGLLIRQGVRRT